MIRYINVADLTLYFNTITNCLNLVFLVIIVIIIATDHVKAIVIIEFDDQIWYSPLKHDIYWMKKIIGDIIISSTDKAYKIIF